MATTASTGERPRPVSGWVGWGLQASSYQQARYQLLGHAASCTVMDANASRPARQPPGSATPPHKTNLTRHTVSPCSACDSPRSPLGRLAPLSVGASCGVQQTLAPAPAGFVPMSSCGMPAEPLSPLAAGLHWADGFAAHEAQPHAPFLSTSSAAMVPEGAPLGPPCGSPNPMDLEQVGRVIC